MCSSGEQSTDDNSTSSPAIIPPYWSQDAPGPPTTLSVERESNSVGIVLQDNTSSDETRYRGYWAKSASIEDHTVVNSNRTAIGAFVVWNITVETLQGCKINLCKRYSEFEIFRKGLVQEFPLSKAALPPLPEKSVIMKFHPKFLENRRLGLQYFLNCVLLNPEFIDSPALQQFLFT
ncbi:hypothetical protein K3495_g8246 [Podosphaera aphanis]|nr:hypothetical protein K3495_g8246 [Podosphaera aphanis]